MVNLDKAMIVDIEGDGLLDEITKLHVLSCAYKDSSGKWQVKSTNKKEDVFRLLEDENNVIVGHNFISFDVPALKIIFPDIQIRATIIDTLPLSYYLYSELQKHGLEEWGEFFGVPKPHIDPIEWKGPLPEETYEQFYNKMRNRCEEDCKINTNLWLKMLAYLREIYDHNDEAVWNVIKYLNFKAQCLHIQDVNPILIDVELAKKNLEYLEGIIEEKSKEIEKILPKVPIYAKRTPPKNPFKKDGSLSVHGEKWFSLLQEHGLPKDYLGEVQVITGYNEPNPTSTSQIKDFLFSKGWVPKIFKDGANGKVPQLRNDDKELCTSITKMFKEYPELEALEGLSVAEHRAGYLKNFVSMPNKDGYVSAWAHGFTRTLRLKHVKPFVNLPKPNAEHGELVRACMVAPKGYVCIGADLSSIEDKCKQISIYPYDPEYVMSMNTKGWDAHLALGLMAGMFTQDEVDFYKWLKSRDKETVIGELPLSFKDMTEEDWKEAFELLDKRRAVAKTTNYACLPKDNTEVLTNKGWKFVDDINMDDKVMSLNNMTEELEFCGIKVLYDLSKKEVISLKNKWWEIECTPEHKWVVDRRTGRGRTRRVVREYKKTSELSAECSIINSAHFKSGSLDMTEDEASILAWILSDGSHQWAKKSNKTSTSKGTKRGIKCVISQSKKKYYLELKDLLQRNGYYKSEYTNSSGCEVFYLRPDKIRKLSKRFGFYGMDKHEVDWSKIILNMDYGCLKSFFKSFLLADGHTGKTAPKMTSIIYQNEGKIKDAIVLCGYLLGNRVTENLTWDSDKCYTIRFSKLNSTTNQRTTKSFSRITDVFCLDTENSNFVIRQNGNITITGNCTYGAGAAKISESCDIPLKEAKKLHKGYWDMNWSVKKFAKDRIVKKVKGHNWLQYGKKKGGLKEVQETTWIWNEFSKMWLFLKNDKDRFSACNQNFGVKIFDVWGYFLIEKGIKPIFQSHDEFLWYCKEEDVERDLEIVRQSVKRLNNVFKPPVPLEIDYKVGKNYAEVH